jgi:hypothetical protein
MEKNLYEDLNPRGSPMEVVALEINNRDKKAPLFEPKDRVRFGRERLEYSFLKDQSRALEIYNLAMGGYGDFRRYLAGKEIIIPDPNFYFKNVENEHDATNPIQGSLNENPNFFVGVVEGMVVPKEMEFVRDYGDMKLSYSGELLTNPKMIRTREYEGEGHKVFPKRFPFLITAAGSDLERYAGLSYEVLLETLEPETTRHIEKWIKKLGKGFREDRDLAEIIPLCLYEEALVGAGIIQNWLKDMPKDRTSEIGFCYNDVIKFNPYRMNKLDMDTSFRQVMRAGAKRALGYYRSNDWKHEDYFMGRF